MVLKTFSAEEMSGPWVRLLLTTLRLHAADDAVGFFRLMRAAPYLLACVLSAQIADMRVVGMRLAAAAYGEPVCGAQ